MERSPAGGRSSSGSGSVRPHAISSIVGTADGLVNPSFVYDGNGNLTCMYQAGGACSDANARNVMLTAFNMAASIV